ncbi:MAG: beta-N-acetylhexosaminidase [Asgard group archaeon]|nr:beta-N-acetylhexosaminidase [Asgard group archaeon]
MLKHKGVKSKRKALGVFLVIYLSFTGLTSWQIYRWDQKQMNSLFPIIPFPSSLTQMNGKLKVESNFHIRFSSSNEDVKRIAETFASFLESSMNVDISMYDFENSSIIPPESSFLELKIEEGHSYLTDEGYHLEITQESISIESSSPKGLFYGIQTLIQIFPKEIEQPLGLVQIINQTSFIDVPCCVIEDTPRFTYRGMHLDVGRHFFPVEFIKKYIDILARYKYNTFHWHLTEDQGWRVEILKYPLLTEIGAYRNDSDSESGVYGGFYTQNEIKDIVKYAEERFITIIPEIEIPGHSLAALAAYPNLSCTGGPFDVATEWGIFEDVFCAGNDETFTFLEDVFTEILDLFPSKYIHIGGDECPKTRWKNCPKCQDRITSEGLSDEYQLQAYFIKRIGKFLESRGRQIIGWNEIMEGGSVPNATVMVWNTWDAAIQATEKGHNVIMSPTTHCYFDYYQTKSSDEPLAIGGFIPLKKIYDFEPIPQNLNDELKNKIIGAQGNVWTEYMKTPEHVEYMILPRLCALAEVVWSPPEQKKWFLFEIRINQHFTRFDLLGWNYHP